MKLLRHFLLVPAIILAGIAVPLTEPAHAGFCSGNNLVQERCKSARGLLRKLLLKRGDNESQKPAKPQPAKPLPIKRDPLQAPPSTITLSDQPSVSRQRQVNVIYVPLPTLRPNYNRSFHAPNITAQPKIRPDIDPTTTAGIFSRCLDVTKITEPDIKAQKRILKHKKFCITEKRLKEGGLDWRIFVIKNKKKKSGPLFVVPHDNENSAFSAGVYGLNKYGGTLVAIEAGERRIFKGQDPNRNFGTSRATSNRCRLQRAPAPRYTHAMLKHLKRRQPIIALHSNANGFSGNGGRGNISIKRKGGAIPFVSAIARSRRLKDEDTLIILASTKRPSQDRRLSRKVKYFTEKAGINVLYEHVTAAKNDCSLSNYAALNGLGPYFNIEVENGDVKTQRKIVDSVMKYLR